MATLKYLLDTNICIYIAKNKPAAVADKFAKMHIGEVGMSLITYAELLFAAEKSKQSKHSLAIVNGLAELIPPLALPINAAQLYAQMRHYLERKGRIIGNNDLWIASHCAALEVTLVTNNLQEFNRLPHLKVVNWL